MKHLLTFFFMQAIGMSQLFGQLPGGVGSPALWFQTTSLGRSAIASYHWQDFSGDSLQLKVYDARGASYGEEFTSSAVRFYNGHPALELEKLTDLRSREVQLKRSNLSQATVIGAFAPASVFDSNQMLYSLHARPGHGVFVGTDKVYHSRESGKTAFDYGAQEGMDLRYNRNDSQYDADEYRENSFRIATCYRSIPPVSGVWGESNHSVLTFNSGYLSGNVNHNSSYSIPLLENLPFRGYIPEIIVYNRLLSPLERREVESYLAIKYGLTLSASYIGSKGQLLWDYASSGVYKYRVTGIYRDDKSGLHQRESATSYEEKPNYSDRLAGDYYFLGNPNHRSSASRLLVIGREGGNSLHEGDYLFWSDNNAAIIQSNVPWQDGLRRMARQWLVKTNISNNPQTLSWTVENLEFNAETNLISVVKAGGNSASSGAAFTRLSLLGQTGYLGVSNYLITGGLTLRFGSQSASYSSGGHDYGYFIDADYRAYRLVGGVMESTSFTQLVLSTTLEVEKTESSLYLRVNGIQLSDSEIRIAPGDRLKSYYGAISVKRGLTDAGFKLRHGGFTDTGNSVELSYANAPDFASLYDENGVLVIDRSGTGDFRADDVEYIPVSEIDILRKKLIFHNVFFDSDGNGQDVFTFAYGKTASLGNLEIIPASCNESDGGFRQKVDWGVRGFKYSLTNSATGASVRSGWEGSRNINVTGIPSGRYELNVSEAGGYSFESSASSGGLLRAKTTNFLPAVDGNIIWRVSNTSDTYSIGYTASTSSVGSAGNVFHYGLKQVGNKLYKLENGNASQLSAVTLLPGDELKIVKGLVSIDYYRNANKAGSSLIRLQDYGLSFYGLIDFAVGPTEVLNANAEGFFNLIDYRWEMTQGVTAARSSGASKKYQIEVPDNCETPVDPGTSIETIGKGDDCLHVSSVSGSLKMHVELRLASPSCNVSLLIYNVSGLLVGMAELPAAQGVQTAEIILPQVGFYIIKALTADGREYGKKTIIR